MDFPLVTLSARVTANQAAHRQASRKKGAAKLCTVIHEEGAPWSVFEKAAEGTPGVEAVTFADGNQVWVGPLFRVVQCACPSNIGYKDRVLWCDFCRCPLCGADTLKEYEREMKSQGWHNPRDTKDTDINYAVLGLAALALLYCPDQTH